MIKPAYNYKGVPIVPGARNAYRPGRYSSSPNPLKPVIRVLLVIIAVLLAGWGVYELFSFFRDEHRKRQEAGQPAAENLSVSEPEPAEQPAEPAQQQASAPFEPTTAPSAPSASAEPAAQPAVSDPAPASVAEVKPADAPAKKSQSLTQEQFMTWRKAEAHLRAGEYEEARALLQEIFQWLSPSHTMYQYTQKLLAKASEGLRQTGKLSKVTYTEYTVGRGDLFSKIAAKHGIPSDVLKQANPKITNPDRLAPGQKVSIPKNSWHAKILPGAKKLFVYDGNRLIRVYSLNFAKLPVRTGNFMIRENNDEWNIYGLNKADIQNLNEYVPTGTLVRVGK